jgi:hypothetical protein
MTSPGAALRAVRPHPHRGDIVAAGALPLVVAFLLVQVRFDGDWASGVLLLLALVPGAFVFGMGLASELEEDQPRAYQSVLLLGGLALLLVTLLRLAEVLGSDAPLDAAGARTWVFVVFAALAAVPAWWLRSALSLLVQLLATIVAVTSLASWVADAGTTAQRWILFLLALIFLLGHLAQRERRRAHAVQFANAAGVAMLALGVSGGGLPFIGGGDGLGGGWELMILAAAFGLVAYAGVDGERGPGYLGVLLLLEFGALAGREASLLWWPLILLAMAATMLAVGLRPRRDLPPEPEMPAGPSHPPPRPPRPHVVGPPGDEA